MKKCLRRLSSLFILPALLLLCAVTVADAAGRTVLVLPFQATAQVVPAGGV